MSNDALQTLSHINMITTQGEVISLLFRHGNWVSENLTNSSKGTQILKGDSEGQINLPGPIPGLLVTTLVEPACWVSAGPTHSTQEAGTTVLNPEDMLDASGAQTSPKTCLQRQHFAIYSFQNSTSDHNVIHDPRVTLSDRKLLSSMFQEVLGKSLCSSLCFSPPSNWDLT